MVFKNKEKDEQAKILSMIDGVRKFALFPVELHNGDKVWLEHYWAYYRGGIDEKGKYFLWSGCADTYVPYSKNSLEKNDDLISITQPKD